MWEHIATEIEVNHIKTLWSKVPTTWDNFVVALTSKRHQKDKFDLANYLLIANCLKLFKECFAISGVVYAGTVSTPRTAGLLYCLVRILSGTPDVFVADRVDGPLSHHTVFPHSITIRYILNPRFRVPGCRYQPFASLGYLIKYYQCPRSVCTGFSTVSSQCGDAVSSWLTDVCFPPPWLLAPLFFFRLQQAFVAAFRMVCFYWSISAHSCCSCYPRQLQHCCVDVVLLLNAALTAVRCVTLTCPFL